MAVQNAVQVTLAYKEESTLGTAPGATGAQLLRRVSSSLAATKDTFTSNEVRSDQQVADMRHGMRSARGTIEGELSPQTYDDLFQGAMRSAWVTGVSAAPADFATGVTVANTTVNGIACSTLTFAGAGSLLNKGFKIGDVVRTTGFTASANNSTSAGNLRIVALTATVMTVFPQIMAAAQQATGWAVAVAGKKITCGTTKRSYAIEQSLADATLWEMFSGLRVNSFSVNAPPNGIATVSWDLLGQGFNYGTSSAYFTSPTAETTTALAAGADGAIRINGVESAIVTAFQMTLTNNMSISPVLGSTIPPEVFYGRMVATGSVSAYVSDASLINAFLNETEVDLVAVLETAGANPQDFVAFNMQRVKFTGAQHQIVGDGGVIVQMPFQALLKTGGTGTAFDQSSLVIQRS